MDTKQVIIIRRDLQMRHGKMAAQVAHASLAFLTKDGFFGSPRGNPCFINLDIPENTHKEVKHWLEHSFAKVCLAVDSEDELLAIHQKALDAGLTSHLVTDNGRTVFDGVDTNTCVGIGPHYLEKFIGITDHLKLY